MNKATALEIVRQCCDSVACDKPTRDKIEAALALLAGEHKSVGESASVGANLDRPISP